MMRDDSARVIRAFIAIDLSPEIAQSLDQVLSDLKRRLPRMPIRWVPVQNIHLTIKFLGDVSVSNQELLTTMLKAEANRHPPFEIQVGDLGVFPSVRRPRVIWVGVESSPELLTLHRGVDAEMARLGYLPEEKSFTPHLTLGRVSRTANSDEIRRIGDVLSGYKVDVLGRQRVQAVHFYRSDLQPSGSVYTRLFTASLIS